MGCLRAYAEQTGVETLKELSLPSASGFVTEVKATGVSARTVNRYVAALMQFGLWLVTTRRVQFDPFDGIKKLNEDAEPVVPRGALPNSVTFQADVRAAGIARKDAEGRVVDMHALRTTYVSWLAMTGAHPKTARTPARHASIETTMERYTDLTLIDMGGTVDRLPLPKAKKMRGRPVAFQTWNRRGDEARRRRVEQARLGGCTEVGRLLVPIERRGRTRSNLWMAEQIGICAPSVY